MTYELTNPFSAKVKNELLYLHVPPQCDVMALEELPCDYNSRPGHWKSSFSM